MWDLVKRNLVREGTIAGVQLGRPRIASVQLKHNEIVEAFLKAGRQKRSGGGRLTSVESVAGESGRTRAVRGGIWRAVSNLGFAIAMAIRLLNPYVLISVAFGQHRSLLAHFSARVDSMRAVLSPRIGRRRRLTAWIQDTLPQRQVSEAATAVWDDGSLLCGIVETAVPGSCPGYDSLSHPNTDRSATLMLGQKLAARYLGVPPAFTDDDLAQPFLSVSMERRLLRYLTAIKAASARVDAERQKRRRALENTDRGLEVEDAFSLDSIGQSSLQPGESLLECVARGMGLILGVRGRKSSFYLYLNPNHPHRHVHRLMQQSNTIQRHPSFEEEAGAILMQIRGPDGDFGAALISTAPGSSSSTTGASLTILNESWYGRIPISYDTTAESVMVSYVPQTSGRHELILLLRGGSHVPGSPFSVTVEESSEVADDNGKRKRFGCEPIDDLSPSPSSIKKTKSHESGLEKTYRRTGSGDSDPGINSEGEVVESRKRKRIVSRVVYFVNEKMLLTDDGKLEKIPKKRRERLKNTSNEEGVSGDQESENSGRPRRKYYSTLSPTRNRTRYLDISEPIYGTYPGRRSPVENGRAETTYGLSKSGFESGVNTEEEYCREAKQVREEERITRERLVTVSDVASHHQTGILNSNNFRDHCRRILWLCDILLEHSPRQESLEILNTAGDILTGKRVHPTIMEESEPEDSTTHVPLVTSSSWTKVKSSSLDGQIGIQSSSSSTSTIAQRLQRTPSETGGLNEVSKWKDGRRQFHSWTRAEKGGGTTGGRLLHKGGSYRGIVVRDMTAEALTGAYAGGDDLVEEDDETELGVRGGGSKGEQRFIFDKGRSVSDMPQHSLTKRKAPNLTKLSENRGYSAETLEQITSSDPDKDCGRTTISGKGLNKSIASKTKEPINYRDEKPEGEKRGGKKCKAEGGENLEDSKKERELKNRPDGLLEENDGKLKNSEGKNITPAVAIATLKGEMREKEVSPEKMLSNIGTKTTSWNDSVTRRSEKALQGAKGEPPPIQEHGGEICGVEDSEIEVAEEADEEVGGGVRGGEVRCQDAATVAAMGASMEAKAPGSAAREINGRLPPPPQEVPTLPPHTIYSSEQSPEIPEKKRAKCSDVARGSTSLGWGFPRMIPGKEREEGEGVEAKEKEVECDLGERMMKVAEENVDNKTPGYEQGIAEGVVKLEQRGKELQRKNDCKVTVSELGKAIEREENEQVKENDGKVYKAGKIKDKNGEDTVKVIEQHKGIESNGKDGDMAELEVHIEIKSRAERVVVDGKREINTVNNDKREGAKTHEGDGNENFKSYHAEKEKIELNVNELVHEEASEKMKCDADRQTGEDKGEHYEILGGKFSKYVEIGAESEKIEKEKEKAIMEESDIKVHALKILKQKETGGKTRAVNDDERSEKTRECEESAKEADKNEISANKAKQTEENSEKLGKDKENVNDVNEYVETENEYVETVNEYVENVNGGKEYEENVKYVVDEVNEHEQNVNVGKEYEENVKCEVDEAKKDVKNVNEAKEYEQNVNEEKECEGNVNEAKEHKENVKFEVNEAKEHEENVKNEVDDVNEHEVWSSNVKYEVDETKEQEDNVDGTKEHEENVNEAKEYEVNMNEEKENEENVKYELDDAKEHEENVKYEVDDVKEHEVWSSNVKYEVDETKEQEDNVDGAKEHEENVNGAKEYEGNMNEEKENEENVKYELDETKEHEENVKYEVDETKEQEDNVDGAKKHEENMNETKEYEGNVNEDKENEENAKYELEDKKEHEENVKYEVDDAKEQKDNVDGEKKHEENVKYEVDDAKEHEKDVKYELDDAKEQKDNVDGEKEHEENVKYEVDDAKEQNDNVDGEKEHEENVNEGKENVRNVKYEVDKTKQHDEYVEEVKEYKENVDENENEETVAKAKEDGQSTEGVKSLHDEEHTVHKETASAGDSAEENNSEDVNEEMVSQIERDREVQKKFNETEVITEDIQENHKQEEEWEKVKDSVEVVKAWLASANEGEELKENPEDTKCERKVYVQATKDVHVEEKDSINYTELVGKLLCTDSFPSDSLEWYEDKRNEIGEEEVEGTMESMEKVDKMAVGGGCAIDDEVWEEPGTGVDLSVGVVASEGPEADEKISALIGGSVKEDEDDVWSSLGLPQFNRGDEEERGESHRMGSEMGKRVGVGVGVVVAGGMMSREEPKNEDVRGGRDAARRRRMWGSSRSKSIEEGLPLPKDESVGKQWEMISIGIDAMEDGCIADVIAGVSGERRRRDRRNRTTIVEVIEEVRKRQGEDGDEVLGKSIRDQVSSDIIEEIDGKGRPITEFPMEAETSEGKEGDRKISISGELLTKEEETKEKGILEKSDVKVCEKGTEVGGVGCEKQEANKGSESQERKKRKGMFEETWWMSSKSSSGGGIRVDEIRMDLIGSIPEGYWGRKSLEEEGVEAKEEVITRVKKMEILEELKSDYVEEGEKSSAGDKRDKVVADKTASDEQLVSKISDSKNIGQLLISETKAVELQPKSNDVNEKDREGVTCDSDDRVSGGLKHENVDEAEEAKELEEEDCECGQDSTKIEDIAGIDDTGKQNEGKAKEMYEGAIDTECTDDAEKDSKEMIKAPDAKTKNVPGVGDWDWHLADGKGEADTPLPSDFTQESENKRESSVSERWCGGVGSDKQKTLEQENSGEWEFVDTGKQWEEDIMSENERDTGDREEFGPSHIYAKSTKELLLGSLLHDSDMPQSTGALEMGLEKVSDFLGSFADISTNVERPTTEGTSSKREGEDLYSVRIAFEEWEGTKGSDNIGPETEVIVGEFDLLGDWGVAGGAIGLVQQEKREEILSERKGENKEMPSLNFLEKANESHGIGERTSCLSEIAMSLGARKITEENKPSSISKDLSSREGREIDRNESNEDIDNNEMEDFEDIEEITTPGWEESREAEQNYFPKREYKTPFRDLEDMLGTDFSFKTISCTAQFNLWPSQEAFGEQGSWMEHIDVDTFMNTAQSRQQAGPGKGLLASMTTFTKTCTTGNSQSSSTKTDQHCFSSAERKEGLGEEENLDQRGEGEEEIVLEEQDFDDRSGEMVPTFGRPSVHSPTYQSFSIESHPRANTGDAFLIFESPGVTTFAPLEGDPVSSDDDDDRVEGLERFGEVAQSNDEEIEGLELGGEWEEGVIILDDDDDDDDEDGMVVGRRGSGEYEKFGDEVVGRVENEIWEMIHQAAEATVNNEMAFAVVMEPEETELKQKIPVHPTGRWCPRLSMLSPAMSAISEEESEEAMPSKDDEGKITELDDGESDNKSFPSLDNEEDEADTKQDAEFQNVKQELPDEHSLDDVIDENKQKTECKFTLTDIDSNKGHDECHEDSDRTHELPHLAIEIEDGFGESFSRRRSSTSSVVSDVGAETAADCGAAFVVSSELAVALALGVSITQIIPPVIDLPETPPMPQVEEAAEAMAMFDIANCKNSIGKEEMREPQHPKTEDIGEGVTKSDNKTEKEGYTWMAENYIAHDKEKFREDQKNAELDGKPTDLLHRFAETKENIFREKHNAQFSSAEMERVHLKYNDVESNETPSKLENGTNVTSNEENNRNTPTKSIETQTEPVIVMTDIKQIVGNGVVVKENILLSVCETDITREGGNMELDAENKQSIRQGDFVLQKRIGKDERVNKALSNAKREVSTTSDSESIKKPDKNHADEPKNSTETPRRHEWDANEESGREEKTVVGPSKKDHIDLVLNNTAGEGETGIAGATGKMGEEEAAVNKNHQDLNAFEKELIEIADGDREGETREIKKENQLKGVKKGGATFKEWEDNWYAEEDEVDSRSPVKLVTSVAVVEGTKGGEVKGRGTSGSEQQIKEPEKAKGDPQGDTTVGENNLESENTKVYSPPGGTKKKELSKERAKESPPRKIPLEKLLGWPTESNGGNGNGAGCSGIASRRESVFDDYHFNLSGFEAKGDAASRKVKTQDSTGLEYYLDVDQLLNVPLEATEPEVKYVSAKEIMDSFSGGVGVDSPERIGEKQNFGEREMGVTKPECSGNEEGTSEGILVDFLGDDLRGESKVNFGSKEDVCISDSFDSWGGSYFADEARGDGVLSLGTDHGLLAWSSQDKNGTPADPLFENSFLSVDLKMGTPTKEETPQTNDPNREKTSENLTEIAKEEEPKRELLSDFGHNIVEPHEPQDLSEEKCGGELREHSDKIDDDKIELETEKRGGTESSGRNVRSIIDIFENSESPAQKKDTLSEKRKKGVESLIALFGEKTPKGKTPVGEEGPAEVAPTEFPDKNLEVRKNEDITREETDMGAARIKEAENVDDEENVLPLLDSADLINAGKGNEKETLLFGKKEGDGRDEVKEKIIALEELGTDSNTKERSIQHPEEVTIVNTTALRLTEEIFKSLPDEPVVGWEAIKVATDVEKIILTSGNGREQNKKIIGGLVIGSETEEMFQGTNNGGESGIRVETEIHGKDGVGENKTKGNDIRGEEKEDKDVARENGDGIAQRLGFSSFSSSLEEYRMAVSEAYGFLDSLGEAIDEEEEGRRTKGNQLEAEEEDGGRENEAIPKRNESESEEERHGLTSEVEDTLEDTFKVGVDTQCSSSSTDKENRAESSASVLSCIVQIDLPSVTSKNESTPSITKIASQTKSTEEKESDEVSSKIHDGPLKSELKAAEVTGSECMAKGDILEDENDECALAKMSVASRKVYWDKRLKEVEEKNKEPVVVTTVTRRPIKISGIVARGRMSFERSSMREESFTSDSGGSGGKSSSESSPSSEEKSRKLRKSSLYSKSQKTPLESKVDQEKKLKEVIRAQGSDTDCPQYREIAEAVDSISKETYAGDNNGKVLVETKTEVSESNEPMLSSKEADDSAIASKFPVSKSKEMLNQHLQENSEEESPPPSVEHRRVEVRKSTVVESTKKLLRKLSTEDKADNSPSVIKVKALVTDSNQELEERLKSKDFVPTEGKPESVKEIKKFIPIKTTGSVSRLAKLFSAPAEPPPPIYRKARPVAKYKNERTESSQGPYKTSSKTKRDTAEEINFKKEEAAPAVSSFTREEKVDNSSSTPTVREPSGNTQIKAERGSKDSSTVNDNSSSTPTVRDPSGNTQIKAERGSKDSSTVNDNNIEAGSVGKKFSLVTEQRPSLHGTGKSNSLPSEGIRVEMEGHLGTRRQKYMESVQQKSREGDVREHAGKVKIEECEGGRGKTGMRQVRNMWERRTSLEYNSSIEKINKTDDDVNKRTDMSTGMNKTAQGKINVKKNTVSSKMKDEVREQEIKTSRVEQTETKVTATILPKMSQERSIASPLVEITASSSKSYAEHDTKMKRKEVTSKQTFVRQKFVSADEEYPAERCTTSEDEREGGMGEHDALYYKKGISAEKVASEKKSAENDAPSEERKAQEIVFSVQNTTTEKNRETSVRGQDVDDNWEIKPSGDKNANLEKSALDTKPTKKKMPFDRKGSLEREDSPKKIASREKKVPGKNNSSPDKGLMDRFGQTETKSPVEIKTQPAKKHSSSCVGRPRKKRPSKMEAWDSWEDEAMEYVDMRGKRDSLEIRVTDDEDVCVMREMTSVPRFFPKGKMETHEEEASQCGSEMEESRCPSPSLDIEVDETKLLSLPAVSSDRNKKRAMPSRTISVQISGIVACGRRRFEGGTAVAEENPALSEEACAKAIIPLEKRHSSVQRKRLEDVQNQQPAEEGEHVNYQRAERDDGAVGRSKPVGNFTDTSRKTVAKAEERGELYRAMPANVMIEGEHRCPEMFVVVGPAEEIASAMEGDEGGDDGRSAISRRAAKGKAPAQKKPPPSATSSPDSESDGVPGAKLDRFLSTPAAKIRRHSAVDVATLRSFSAAASEAGLEGSKVSLPTRRRGSGDLGSPARRKEDESKKRFSRARQFFECLEKGKDSPPSLPQSGAEDSGTAKVLTTGKKKKTRRAVSGEDGLKTASIGRRTAVKHRAPLRGIHDSSESTTESEKEKRHKRKGRRCSLERTHSAPGSDVDSSGETPNKHPAHRRKREKDFVLRSQRFGGSERQVRVAERFNVMDLFRDVAGPLSGGGSGRATPLGIPHQAAVLAALRSVEDVRSTEAASPYDMYRPMEAANDCEPSTSNEENANSGVATAEDEENNVSFQSPMTLCVKREYHAEYPHLPMTSPRHSRHRSSNTDLIPRNVLLQLDNNNQGTQVTPKRRSIAELF